MVYEIGDRQPFHQISGNGKIIQGERFMTTFIARKAFQEVRLLDELPPCLAEQKHDLTGFLASIYETKHINIDIDIGGAKYISVCHQHQTMASYHSKHLAQQSLHLVEWCGACQKTDAMKIARALRQMKERTYIALSFVGKDRDDAFRLASRWSSIGRAGVVFATQDQRSRFVDGYLVGSLELYCQGDIDGIQQVFRDVGLQVRDPHFVLQSFFVLVIEPLSNTLYSSVKHS